MRTYTILLICLVCAISTHAQKVAVTELGETVILYDDGTWKYEKPEDIEAKEIPLNPKKFVRGKSSSFLLKSSKINLGFWLDPKKWAFNKGEADAEGEYELDLKNEDLYGMIITEKVEIPLETLKSIAMENAKAAAPDLRLMKEEYRMVNGLKVLMLQMNGTMQGIKFSYFGYYYSNKNGTVQFITYTSQALLKQYKTTCEELLNGLVEIK